MKSKIGIILMTLGAMFVTAALSLAVYNIYTDRQAEKNSGDVLIKLEEEISQRSETSSIILNNETDEKEAVSIAINNNEYIGIINIPSINIKLPVLKEWNYDNLDIAPCRYNGSITEGGFIIAAHNYSGHFGKLKNLVLDDEIYFTDTNGKAHIFYVDLIETINGNQPDKMLAGEWDLTLFTCNFDGTARVTIRCKKV